MEQTTNLITNTNKKIAAVAVLLMIAVTSFWGSMAGAQDVALTISDVKVVNVGLDTATVTWNTNLMADSKLEYGLTSTYTDFIPSTLNTITHETTIIRLKAKTTYHFRVSGTSAGKMAISGDQTFTTLSVEENTTKNGPVFPVGVAPIISNISTSVQDSMAVITWSTDQESNSNVNFGLRADDLRTTASSPMTTNHRVVLNNLTPGTTYYVQVYSRNKSGLVGTSGMTTLRTSGTAPVQMDFTTMQREFGKMQAQFMAIQKDYKNIQADYQKIKSKLKVKRPSNQAKAGQNS